MRRYICEDCNYRHEDKCFKWDGLGDLEARNFKNCDFYSKDRDYRGQSTPLDDKRTFETGATRSISTSKGRYDLLPWDAIHQLAIHCAKGAEEHGERNCEKGIPLHSLLDSATRHIGCYMRGQTKEPHLVSALWNIAFAIEMEINNKEMQDIPYRLRGGNNENR